MTLGSFIVRNAFRNKLRSVLTMISISFSLLLLTLMICIWRSFYVDQVAPEASRRLIIRDRVSLAFFLPAFYRDKIRAVPGVSAVAPLTWFGGRYIDDRPVHFFAQMATDPDEYIKVASDKIIPPDQLKAWQQDRAGAIVDVTLADKYGW
jgi:putative ABC transport system permease protein